MTLHDSQKRMLIIQSEKYSTDVTLFSSLFLSVLVGRGTSFINWDIETVTTERQNTFIMLSADHVQLRLHENQF